MCTFLLTYNDLDRDKNTKHDDNILYLCHEVWLLYNYGKVRKS